MIYKVKNKIYGFVDNLFQKLIIREQHLNYKRIRNKYNIPDNFRFNGNNILFYGDGKLEIDDDSYIGGLSTIQLHPNAIVRIGKGCSISHNVRIYTSSKIPDYDFKYKHEVPEKVGNVNIGDYAWIGANVFINPGVSIGSNCVVGANSVITKNLEPNGIYGGVPAKLIRLKKYA